MIKKSFKNKVVLAFIISIFAIFAICYYLVAGSMSLEKISMFKRLSATNKQFEVELLKISNFRTENFTVDPVAWEKFLKTIRPIKMQSSKVSYSYTAKIHAQPKPLIFSICEISNDIYLIEYDNTYFTFDQKAFKSVFPISKSL